MEPTEAERSSLKIGAPDPGSYPGGRSSTTSIASSPPRPRTDGADPRSSARIAGPRGTLSAFSVALDWPPHASAARQASVRHLVSFVLEVAGPAFPTVICGDFNAPPDSDELRMLTGRTDTVASGFSLFDAWEMAGDGSGHTWARSNPWTAPALLPDKRIDYILVGRPRRGGAGHVVRCSIGGTVPMDGVVPSDHYAVVADLRY
jgi:endonuclease/exonuclease/phosphatase family metal-dependent hydrolase